MAISIKKVQEAYERLRVYEGNNPYIVQLKNQVFAYKTKELNEFEVEYVIMNYDNEPKRIDRMVKIADWYGEKKQIDWNTEFVPKKLKITWLLGETSHFYHFFCYYRKSQEKAVLTFAPKRGILTDIKHEDFHNTVIDFRKYDSCGKTLYPYQEEAVKFLVARKRGILASEMGSGKTLAAIIAALESQYKKILIICPASLKTNWQRELLPLVPKDDITIVEGTKWDEKKFTIINYEILKNFYTVPTEKVMRSALEVNDEGNIEVVQEERTVISRKSSVIGEAMEDSQLFQSQFDLIIIDEAHRLSNTSSGIYKIVSDLVKRSKPMGIYEITRHSYYQ